MDTDVIPLLPLLGMLYFRDQQRAVIPVAKWFPSLEQLASETMRTTFCIFVSVKRD